MKHDNSLMPETIERKERVFLPAFPLKSSLISASRKKRALNVSESKSKTILSPEDLKFLCEKIETKKKISMPPLPNREIMKNPIRMKTFRFNKLMGPVSQGHSPIPLKPVYFTKIFNKRTKDIPSEPYKFMLTGANFNYLNSRILELDSSTHSIQDVQRLDARYTRQYSPDMRQNDSPGVYYKTSANFNGKDYSKRRVVFKNINIKS